MKRTLTAPLASVKSGTEFTHRIGAAISLPGIARNLGRDPTEAFSAAGLDESLFASADNRVPVTKLGKFVSEIARLIERPDLGLLIARSQELHSLGALLTLAEEGPDVRTALLKIARLLKHNNGVAFLTLLETESDAVLSYELLEPDIDGANIVLDASLGIALRVMRHFCGDAWYPAEVRLSRARPKDPTPYETFFGAPIRFDSSMDCLVFSRHWLALPVAPHSLDSGLRRQAHAPWDFPDRIQHEIAVRIGLMSLTATDVAATVGLSRRDLDRKLAASGTTFRKLLEKLRYARARRLLAASHVPLADISLALGYTEPSAFSRAFRAWSGVSPQHWRKSHAKAHA